MPENMFCGSQIGECGVIYRLMEEPELASWAQGVHFPLCNHQRVVA